MLKDKILVKKLLNTFDKASNLELASWVAKDDDRSRDRERDSRDSDRVRDSHEF